MIWFKYQLHEYMDEKPEIGFRLFSDSDAAYKWEKHMNDTYSGGTTTILGHATQDEVLKFVSDNNLKLDESILSDINNSSYYI